MEAPMDMDQAYILYEQDRMTCEAAYAINPLDADNLTKWGGALLELYQIQGTPQLVKGKCYFKIRRDVKN
ncbi:hypothetical protein Sjap_016495 [Stephania japonica]|uniref:Uncharacterized protein n=1 Tax=Stephania japonica TaxID=461633 RepID=A0AAP0NSF7_9MAGN